MKTSAFFDVYDICCKHFEDIIEERYVAAGNKWVRFNFKGCGKFGLVIYFKETKDGKIKVLFANEYEKFLPSFLKINKHFNSKKNVFQGASVCLDVAPDSEIFFTILRKAVNDYVFTNEYLKN